MATVPDNAPLDLGTAMTVEAWVKPRSATDWRTVLFKESGSGVDYALYSSSDTHVPSVNLVLATSRFALPVSRYGTLLVLIFSRASNRLPHKSSTTRTALSAPCATASTRIATETATERRAARSFSR